MGVKHSRLKIITAVVAYITQVSILHIPAEVVDSVKFAGASVVPKTNNVVLNPNFRPGFFNIF